MTDVSRAPPRAGLGRVTSSMRHREFARLHQAHLPRL